MSLPTFKSYTRYAIPLLIFIPVLVFSESTQKLPDLGDSAGSVISPQYEKRLGQLFMKQVRHRTKIVSDLEIQSYIQSLGHQLVSHSDNFGQVFSFFAVDNSTINAFAGPGGVIGIHTGVILNSANESEIAAVIAHEISHVTQRHLARMFEEVNRYRLPIAAAILGAIMIGIADPQAGKTVLAGVYGIRAQNQINFTRANEEEADRIGMQLLARTGYNPRGMPSFFERLQQMTRYSENGVPEFLRTHPLTTSRIADSVARAEKYPVKNYTNSLSYELIRQKIYVDSFKIPNEAVLHLKKQLENKQINEKEKLSIRYGLAYACIGNQDYTLASQQIRHLLKDNPNEVAYLLLAAKLETKQSNYNTAFKIFKKAYDLYTDYKPVIIDYSRALLDVKRAKEARDILKKYQRYHAHDLNTYSLLAQAEAMLGNEFETAMLKTEYYYFAGETQLAIDKLKFIKQQHQLNYYQKERILARMTELEYELELENKIKL